jgi:hypothetical protein
MPWASFGLPEFLRFEDLPPCGLDHLKLKDMLQDWSGLGSGYRFAGSYNALFLKTSIYGTQPGSVVENRLWFRYRDWASASSREPFIRMDYSRRGKKKRLLPDPYNMGEGWYEAAFKIIRRDLARWKCWSAWHYSWLRFRVYRDNRHLFLNDIADSVANVFSDWRKMVDF